MTFEILETPQGYFLKRERRLKQLTNFTIRPRKEFIQPSENGPIRISIEADLLQEGRCVATRNLPEEIWVSNTVLRQAIAGVEDLTYFGNRIANLQRLKGYILKDVTLETVHLPDMSKRRRYACASSPLYKLDHDYGDPTQPEYAGELIRIWRNIHGCNEHGAEKAGIPLKRWRLLAKGQTQPTPEEVKGLLIVRDSLSRREDNIARANDNYYLRIGQRRRTISYQPEMD